MRPISEMLGKEGLTEILKKGTVSRRDLFTKVLPRAGVAAAGIVLLGSEKAKAVDVIPVASPEEAGRLFGLSAETRDASRWRINQYGGAEFLGTGDGRHHLVLLNEAEMEGWTQVRRADGRDTSPFVAHRNVVKVLANSGTLWRHVDAGFGWNKLVYDKLYETSVTHPERGDIVVPMRFAYATVDGNLSLNPVSSPGEAAKLFGINAETKDPGVWRINSAGAAEFLGTGDGRSHPLRLNHAEMEGWTQVRRADGRDASPFVAHRNAGRVLAVSGTIWPTPDEMANLNWQNIVENVIAFQNKNYPTNLLVPIRA